MSVDHLDSVLESQREELLDFVSRFVQIESVTGDEAPAAEFLEEWFRENGFDSERHVTTAEDAARWPDLSEADLPRRPSIIGTLRAADRRAADFALNGHIDVVPSGVEEGWVHPPFGGVREGGRIWGRGTSDMKAGLAAGLFATRALRDSGIELPFDIQLQCVIAEESGGLGSLSVLTSRPGPYSGAIVAEPTSSRIASACGGAQPFTVTVEGRAAHISIPWTGVDAFEKLLIVHRALHNLEDRRERELSHPLFDLLPQKAALAIGVVEAGEWRLSLPESARLLGRLGSLPSETVSSLREAIREAVELSANGDEWLVEHRPTLSWDGPGFAGWETPSTEPLVASLVAAAGSLGGDASLTAATYGSDAGKFATRGVPVALVGPGDLNEAHTKNESVGEDDVIYVSRLIAQAIARLGHALENGGPRS